MFPDDFHLLTPEALATYVVAIIGFWYGFRQIRRNLRLNKKTEVFNILSQQINKAKELIQTIDSAANELLDSLAKEADASSNFATQIENATPQQQEQEVLRRLEQLNIVEKKQLDHINAIYDSQGEIIKIVAQIDKSTVIKAPTKEVAKHIYFLANEQHRLVQKANEVILSLNVVPNLNQLPNIDPKTFKAIIELYAEITSRNSEVRNYLDDLEVELHNDLVKKVFGKATRGELPEKYLTKDGLKDKRVKKALR